MLVLAKWWRARWGSTIKSAFSPSVCSVISPRERKTTTISLEGTNEGTMSSWGSQKSKLLSIWALSIWAGLGPPYWVLDRSLKSVLDRMNPGCPRGAADVNGSVYSPQITSESAFVKINKVCWYFVEIVKKKSGGPKWVLGIRDIGGQTVEDSKSWTRAVLWHSPWQLFVAAPKACSAKKIKRTLAWQMVESDTRGQSQTELNSGDTEKSNLPERRSHGAD